MKRVLIVPDRLISEEMGATYFDRHSFTVRSARHATEAVGVARAFRPDLVVLRSDLPGVGALDLCKALRAAHPTMKLLVIHEMIGEEDADYTGIVDARLIQPVHAEQLLTTIAALLEIRVRRGPRANLETLVQLSGFGLSPEDTESSLANSIDVSEYGILLETAAQLDLGSPGAVSFFLPGTRTRLAISGVARVAIDEVLLHYAIEFAAPDQATRSCLRDYVAEQLNPAARGESP